MGIWHERIAFLPKSTVHAPHIAMPHPNLVPTNPRLSRKTQSKGVAGSASTVSVLPFIFNLKIATLIFYFLYEKKRIIAKRQI
jgi:hypothetical protein